MKTNSRALLIVPLALALASCKSLTPAQQARVDRFECEVAAVEPHVKGVLDAAELVRDWDKGQVNLRAILMGLGALEGQVEEVNKALKLCAPLAPNVFEVAPPPDQGEDAGLTPS